MPVLSHGWSTRRVSWSDLDMVAPAAALRGAQEHSLNVRGACPNMRGAYLEVLWGSIPIISAAIVITSTGYTAPT
jgi:Co/Zn/Cd efflux system component